MSTRVRLAGCRLGGYDREKDYLADWATICRRVAHSSSPVSQLRVALGFAHPGSSSLHAPDRPVRYGFSGCIIIATYGALASFGGGTAEEEK